MSDEPDPHPPSSPAAAQIRAAAATVDRWTHGLISKSAFLLFGIAVFVLVRLAVESVPLAVQIAVLAFVYAPLGLLIYRLAKMPDETLAPFRRHGLAQPAMFVTGLWLAAIGWFSSLAFVLDERGVVDFTTRAGAAIDDTGRLADFFVWQSFQQIPALDVNDTLHWEMPLHYGGGAGVVVLAFKLLILLPLVPVFLAAVRHRRPVKGGGAPAAASSAPARPDCGS